MPKEFERFDRSIPFRTHVSAGGVIGLHSVMWRNVSLKIGPGTVGIFCVPYGGNMAEYAPKPRHVNVYPRHKLN